MKVKLSRRGVERWANAHPWIYESDVEAPKALKGGEVVQVTDHRGYLLGQAFFSRTSKIQVRWLTWDDRPIDAAFFKARIESADAGGCSRSRKATAAKKIASSGRFS